MHCCFVHALLCFAVRLCFRRRFCPVVLTVIFGLVVWPLLSERVLCRFVLAVPARLRRLTPPVRLRRLTAPARLRVLAVVMRSTVIVVFI